MTATCPVCGCESVDALLCHADTERLERDLGDVPALVADLDVTISRMSKVGAGGKGGLASERTPIRELAARYPHNPLSDSLCALVADLSPGAQTDGEAGRG